mmetsp:Transcript_12537/g.23863  ORF Transcript_12537/g.23863 Transcript_12537/m.23863 type:complete len:121 (-) Transcript_12537:331-693(-)
MVQSTSFVITKKKKTIVVHSLQSVSDWQGFGFRKAVLHQAQTIFIYSSSPSSRLSDLIFPSPEKTCPNSNSAGRSHLSVSFVPHHSCSQLGSLNDVSTTTNFSKPSIVSSGTSSHSGGIR